MGFALIGFFRRRFLRRHWVRMESVTNPPINWKKNLFFIWLCQFLSIAGFSLALPFVPIYIRDRWGITGEHELGLWMSAFYFFGMLSYCGSTPLWGVLADRFGRKLMLLRACYVDGLLFPCFLLAPNPVWLIVMRFITSAFTGTVAAAQTLIVTNTPEEHHGFCLGTLSSAIWCGNLAGFAVGGVVVHHFGFTAAFLACGALYLLAGASAHFFVRENFTPPPKGTLHKAGNPFRGLSAAAWMVFLMIIVMAIGRKFDEPYIALMVERIAGPEKTALFTGWISAVAALGGIGSGMVIGHLCDLWSAEKVTLPIALVAAAGMFAQAAAGSLLFFGTARFLNNLAAAGLEPAFFSILAKVSPAERRGTVFGLASSLRMGGILLGSALSGAVIWLAGVRFIFVTAGIFFLILVPMHLVARRLVGSARNVEEETLS